MWKYLVFLILIFSPLHAQIKVLAFAGSTREDSMNKKLAKEALLFAKEAGAETTFIDLKDLPLPFYDADLEAQYGMPENARKLRSLMIESQVIILASPEYNASITALLKNTLDWASRSENRGPSREAFQGKKFILLSASPGKGGGARGLLHLRIILDTIQATTLTPSFSLPQATLAFEEDGKLKNPQLRATLRQLIQTSIQS